MELPELIQQLQALIDEAKKLGTSDEDNARYAELETQMDALQKKIDAANAATKTAEERAQRLKGADEFLNKTAGHVPFQVKAGGAPGSQPAENRVQVRGRNGRLKHFKGATAEKDAFEFGVWFLSEVGNVGWAKKIAKDSSLDFREKADGQNESVNSDGGATVPTRFSNTIIDLREEHGIFRQAVNIEGMTTDNQIIPRSKGTLTAFPVGEGKEGTFSKTAWDQVELTARKWMVLARYSSEVNADSIIAWADRLAYEIAYAFSLAEDQAGFLGDGTSAYHKILGIIPKIRSIDATPGNVKALVTGTGGAWASLVLRDFLKMKGRLPAYARNGTGPSWYCSTTFHSEVMESLALAAGGNSAAEIVNGSDTPRFLGFPVKFVQSLPIEEIADDVPCVLANLRQGVTMGDRPGMALALSEHSSFRSDQVEIRGIARYDINCHDVGEVLADGTNKVGSAVGLYVA